MVERVQLLFEEENFANDEEDKKVKLRPERLFDLKGTLSFYTRDLFHYQQRSWSERLEHRSVVKRAVHCWYKWPLLYEAIDVVDFDAPGEVSTTSAKYEDMSSSILRFPQEEPVYKLERVE